MSQATDWSVPLSGPVTPNEMADRMDKSLDALLSSHSGASRPAYAVAGTVWLSTATAGQHKYYEYDGGADRLILTINTTTGAVTFPGLVVGTNVQAFDAGLNAIAALAVTDGNFIVGNGATWVAESGATVRASLGADDPWRFQPVGGVVYIDTSLGLAAPPTNQEYRYAELTAGLTGAGGYNNGVLTTESVSGSAPLVLATAVVSLAGSPLNGKTIRLLNTEGRILRPSTSPGTLQNDTIQGHIHAQLAKINAFSSATPAGELTSVPGGGIANNVIGNTGPATTSNMIGDPATDGTNGTPRTANETRMKNVGVKAYMRIK